MNSDSQVSCKVEIIYTETTAEENYSQSDMEQTTSMQEETPYFADVTREIKGIECPKPN